MCQDARQAGEQGGLGRPSRAPGQSRPRILAHIQVRHLCGGVDAGIGTARHGQSHGLPQDGLQSLGEDAFDGTQARLRGPAVEVGAVVGQVQTHPEDMRFRPLRSGRSLGHGAIGSCRAP